MSSFLDSQKTQSIVGINLLNQQVNNNVKALKISQEEGNRLREEQIQIASNISAITSNLKLKAILISFLNWNTTAGGRKN